MRTLPTTLLSLVGLAAGCVGTDPEPAPAAPAAVDDTTAGGTAATPPEDAAAAAKPTGTAEEPPVEVIAPIAYDVQTGTWATACHEQLPGGCLGEGVAPAEGTTTQLPFDGALTAVEITLTWTAATPATNELRFAISWGAKCGADCIEVVGSESVEGASPLLIALPDLAGEGIEILYAHVSIPRPDVPVAAWASVDQAAKVEGTLTSLVAPLH